MLFLPGELSLHPPALSLQKLHCHSLAWPGSHSSVRSSSTLTRLLFTTSMKRNGDMAPGLEMMIDRRPVSTGCSLLLHLNSGGAPSPSGEGTPEPSPPRCLRDRGGCDSTLLSSTQQCTQQCSGACRRCCAHTMFRLYIQSLSYQAS